MLHYYTFNQNRAITVLSFSDFLDKQMVLTTPDSIGAIKDF